MAWWFCAYLSLPVSLNRLVYISLCRFLYGFLSLYLSPSLPPSLIFLAVSSIKFLWLIENSIYITSLSKKNNF